MVKDREIKNAFFILSYIKKLCLHPHLLCNTSLSKKKEIGIISYEEELVLAEERRILEEKESGQVRGIQTRRGKKETQVEKKKNPKRSFRLIK